MTKEQEFFIYLLEYYAKYKDRPTSKVLEELEALDLTDFICNEMYWRYSTEAIENAFEDIDMLIAEKKAQNEVKKNASHDTPREYARRVLDSLSEEQLIEFIRIFGDENIIARMESELLANTSDTQRFQDVDVLFTELETE